MILCHKMSVSFNDIMSPYKLHEKTMFKRPNINVLQVKNELPLFLLEFMKNWGKRHNFNAGTK